MAVITTNNSQKAEVHAPGTAMNATVNFSGALMEMLATVYANILMAAIREALQNACDAAKRAGLTFSEGVLVQLPTPSNPMITVIDKGSGMTKAFMEDPEGGYLSYGSSTKSGDNGAAGGLGIGRWAAYGYIRECYITTCHASDMVQRTYFQFQGDNATPKVQSAAEVPGSEIGTKVAFPIKESDLDEALRAVSWLKDVMQLTMGDSFSVDNPHLLPKALPPFSGTALNLETVDPGLRGVVVYPMKGSALRYGRQELQTGSLIVLTNKEAGVGGLPFHVQSLSGTQSVFFDGMVVEIPMSFRIPFMPSREEIKYTDEVTTLLARIDAAAALAVVEKAKELFDAPSLESKAALSNLLGNEETWHWFARGTRGESSIREPLRLATGGRPWAGDISVPFLPEMAAPSLSVKYTNTTHRTLREGLSRAGHLAIRNGTDLVAVLFHPNHPLWLVVNDLPAGGVSRFRSWMATQRNGHSIVFFTSSVAGEAQAAAEALNKVYGGVLEVFFTSRMPTVARVVTTAGVTAARGRVAGLTYYSRSASKQLTETMSYAGYSSREPVRIWLGKNGAQLEGFKADVQLQKLNGQWEGGALDKVLAAFNVDRLYLLTPKQASELSKAQDSARADGLWDMADSDFTADEESQDAKRAVTALKSWKPLEVALAELIDRQDIQDMLAGKLVRAVKEDWEFYKFCEALATRPRMELTGTSFDKAMAPHIDLLTGELRLHRAGDLNKTLQSLADGLALLGKSLQESVDDSTERKELIDALKRCAIEGAHDYTVVWKELRNAFPLLRIAAKFHELPGQAADDLCTALALLYR